jgi:hypothetical protein
VIKELRVVTDQDLKPGSLRKFPFLLIGGRKEPILPKLQSYGNVQEKAQNHLALASPSFILGYAIKLK